MTPTVELTPFPDGVGYLEYAWDGLTEPQRRALDGEFAGSPTLKALARYGFVTGRTITPRGRELLRWAQRTGRWPA